MGTVELVDMKKLQFFLFFFVFMTIESHKSTVEEVKYDGYKDKNEVKYDGYNDKNEGNVFGLNFNLHKPSRSTTKKSPMPLDEMGFFLPFRDFPTLASTYSDNTGYKQQEQTTYNSNTGYKQQEQTNYSANTGYKQQEKTTYSANTGYKQQEQTTYNAITGYQQQEQTKEKYK